jgi:hypothetical protein
MAITIGYSAGFLLLVGIAIVVGMKLMHDHHVSAGVAGGPTALPNGVNPATAPSSLKY